MKIFISHSKDFNFQDELYSPLKNSELAKHHEFIFPYEDGKEIAVKDVIRDCDMVVAEVSKVSFEQGLELGWANGAYITTVCFYKPGSQVSTLLKDITDSVFEYSSMEEVTKKIAETADAL